MKKKFSDGINRVLRQIVELNSNMVSFKVYLRYATNLITDMPKFYLKANDEAKYKLVCSIFPEKIYFEKSNYRTPKLHPVLEVISLKINELYEQKKRPSNAQSLSVVHRGIEPLFPE